jgi:hypothetical protein
MAVNPLDNLAIRTVRVFSHDIFERYSHDYFFQNYSTIYGCVEPLMASNTQRTGA